MSARAGSTIRIATRGSRQAVTQSQAVADLLGVNGFEAELVLISTLGDRTQAGNVPLHSIGGQGVFVKEVQQVVLDGAADIAVHSSKDLPSTEAPGLTLGAFTARRSPGDALVGSTLDALEQGATVATGSVRRRAQLGRARPDLAFEELRGNIETRLTKVPLGGAIVMAIAALEVLDLTDRITERLDPTVFVPAVGQGCVAVEHRTGDARIAEALATIDHAPTRDAVVVERSFLAELGSGCSLPVGAFVDGDLLHTFLSDAASGLTVTDAVTLVGDLTDRCRMARSAARSALEFVSAS